MEIEMRLGTHGKIWYKKGDMSYWHREDGPARIYYDKSESWFYYNKLYDPDNMPFNLFLAYCKWEYRKKHGN